MSDRTIPNLRMTLANHLTLTGPEERDLLAILGEVELLREERDELRAELREACAEIERLWRP